MAERHLKAHPNPGTRTHLCGWHYRDGYKHEPLGNNTAKARSKPPVICATKPANKKGLNIQPNAYTENVFPKNSCQRDVLPNFMCKMARWAHAFLWGYKAEILLRF